MESLKSRRGIFELLPIWLQGWTGLWTSAAMFYVIVYSSWIFFKWGDPAYHRVMAGLGYLPLGLFSAISSIYAALQSHLDSRTRRAWRLIALSSIAVAFGDIIYVAFDLTKGVGFPDIPDIFYLAYYPLVVAGLINIPTQIRYPSQNKMWALDLTIFAVSASSILWYFVVASTALAGGRGWFAQLIAGAYPALDLPVLVSVLSILFRRPAANTRASLYILGLGLLIYIIADLAYVQLVLLEAYVDGSWVDILWTLSYLAVGIAALRQSYPFLVEGEDRPETRVSWWAPALPFSAVAISVIMSCYASFTGAGVGLRTNGLLIGTTATILLAIVRQAMTLRENARLVKELISATSQLESNSSLLEQRVTERTRDLEKQTFRLRLASEVARDAASAKGLDELLTRATRLISERFDFYHTAIFLIDNKREYATLIASPTAAGKQMMADNYRLRIDTMNIIGQVSLTGEPRILLDSGADAIHFNNPLLPNSYSEIALPLKVEANVIGVLDVQSDRPQTFNQDDVAIMQIMADQLATAIERTRLLQEVEKNLSELERAYGQHTRESWQSISGESRTGNKGFRFDNLRIQPIAQLPELGSEVFAQGTTITSNGSHAGPEKQNTVAIPIKLRGQIIGVISAKLKEGYHQNTISTIEAAAERLALAIESARLYEEARLRADREQSISRVATAISASTEYEEVLRSTVTAVGKFFTDSEVRIQILHVADQEREPATILGTSDEDPA